VGPLLGAIPAILVAASVSTELALVVAGIYVVLQVLEGNVLVPLVMRNTIGISPFLVIVSVLVGATAGGIVGALFAVPVAATIVVLLERLQAREVPVAQDSGSVDSLEPNEVDAVRRSLPDRSERAGPRRNRPVMPVRAGEIGSQRALWKVIPRRKRHVSSRP